MLLVSLNILQKLVGVVTDEIEPFLGTLLPPIASKIMVSDSYIRDAVNQSNDRSRIH
jgi:hypothetical protein